MSRTPLKGEFQGQKLIKNISPTKENRTFPHNIFHKTPLYELKILEDNLKSILCEFEGLRMSRTLLKG